jgi:hypothetical protein
MANFFVQQRLPRLRKNFPNAWPTVEGLSFGAAQEVVMG